MSEIQVEKNVRIGWKELVGGANRGVQQGKDDERILRETGPCLQSYLTLVVYAATMGQITARGEFMSLRQKLKKYAAFPLVSLFRLIYSSAQAKYAIDSFGEYAFKEKKHPAATLWSVVAIVANIATNAIVKIPAVYQKFAKSPQEPVTQSAENTQPLLAVEESQSNLQPQTIKGKSVVVAFKSAGIALVMLEFIASYFSVNYSLDAWAQELDVAIHDSWAGEIGAQMISLGGGISAAITFYSYEYKVVANRNSQLIGRLLEEGNLASKASENTGPVLKTSTVMMINLITYTTLASFWAKAATDDFSEKHGILDDTAKYIICVLAGVFTSVFTLGWSPSFYEVFDNKAAEEVAHVRERNWKTKAVMGLAVTALPMDVATWVCTTYLSVVSTFRDFMEADEYGPIILLGSLCGLAAGAFYGLSLRPGVNDTLDMVGKASEVSSNRSALFGAPDLKINVELAADDSQVLDRHVDHHEYAELSPRGLI